MASNTRGKLKENFEGMHRNFDWIIYHCQKSLDLIQEHNPKLTKGVEALYENVKILDDLTQKIYTKL